MKERTRRLAPSTNALSRYAYPLPHLIRLASSVPLCSGCDADIYSWTQTSKNFTSCETPSQLQPANSASPCLGVSFPFPLIPVSPWQKQHGDHADRLRCQGISRHPNIHTPLASAMICALFLYRAPAWTHHLGKMLTGINARSSKVLGLLMVCPGQTFHHLPVLLENPGQMTRHASTASNLFPPFSPLLLPTTVLSHLLIPRRPASGPLPHASEGLKSCIPPGV